MIRRLHIEGWRAFEDVTLELDEGVTFVVAENGVGKTSLIQAAAWGLFGSLSGVDAHAARRFGTSTARVTVDVELPDGTELNIVREASERSDSMQARFGYREVDDSTIADIIADSFGATREFLSKTTIISSDSVADDSVSAFQLRDHLCHVFGVDGLQAAATKLEQLHTSAEAVAKKVRQQSRRAAADLAAVRAELDEAAAAQEAADVARRDARAAVETAEQHRQLALEQRAARDKAIEAEQAFAEVMTSARQLLNDAAVDDIDGPAALTARLEDAESAAAEALDQHRREAATIAGQLAAVGAAASELHRAGAECPVCRRELSAEDVGYAEQAHEQERSALSARELEIATRVDEASQLVNDLRALTRRAARLPEIALALDSSVVDVDVASLALDRDRADLEQLIENAVAARTRREALAAQIADEEHAAREMQAAALAHRREAVTSVAAEVMRATADTILSERIDPLAAEISHRWKRVFGERGMLRLRHDGHLVLVRGVHEIPFTQFSSGEKVVALLATRLLVLSASTRASFLWLDEPLEHLDPKNRRLTASLMTTAGKHVRQILVTTYEEALARRLASATHAQLRYVRAADR